MIEIRPASKDDLDWLVGELREFDKFYATKKSLFGDERYVRKKLVEIIEQHVFLAACSDSRPVGFIAGLLHPHFYNPSIGVLTELFWWVIPGFRHSPAANMLMDEFIAYGKRFGAGWITFNFGPNTQINPMSMLKKGFVATDQTYLMEI